MPDAALAGLRRELAQPLPHPDLELLRQWSDQLTDWLLRDFETLPDQSVGVGCEEYLDVRLPGRSPVRMTAGLPGPPEARLLHGLDRLIGPDLGAELIVDISGDVGTVLANEPVGTDREFSASFDRESSATRVERAVSGAVGADFSVARHAAKCAE